MAVKPIPDGFHTVTPYLVVPDVVKLIDFLKQAFDMTKAECRMLDRGTEFPKSINGATRLVRADRRRVSRPAARPA